MDNSYRRECTSIYRGIVESNEDPENLGRCKIRVPSIHGNLTYPIDILPWARPLVLSPIKSNRGSVNLPDVGDIVWVLFEGSNRDFPVYLGGTYAIGDMEVENKKVVFYLENDDSMIYDREERTYDIRIGDRHIIIDPELINIKGDTLIEGNTEIIGNLHVTGFITSDTDVLAGDISLRHHVHGGVRRGGELTDEPVAQ